MNPRKVLYPCFLVCLTVLLGFSWSASAAAEEPIDRRLAAGPNWGAAGNPLPVPVQSPKTRPGVMSVPVKSTQPPLEPWDALWRDVWKKSSGVYRIDVADTVRQVPACTGNLGLEVIVGQTVRAVRDRKFGDAVRYMAQFQDRSLCLTYEGARGLDAALTRYTERAIRELPSDQQRIAIHGTFNLAMLAIDQLDYTGKSWWQGIVGVEYYPQMVAQMNAYPIKDLGLWSYNFENGLLVQSTSIQALLDKLAILGNPIQGKKGGGGGGGATGGRDSGPGGMAGVGGMGNTGTASCMVAALGSSAGRGMLTCMQKATAGIRPSVGNVLAGPFDPSVSVRDPQCARSEVAGNKITDFEDRKKEPPTTDNRSIFQKFWDWLWSDPTPPPPPPKGTLKLFPEGNASRTAPGDPGGGGVFGGGACGNASNMAKRAQALYDCYAGGGGPALVGGKTPGPGGVNPGVVDPSPDQDPKLTDRAAGMLACLTQAGSLVRNDANDPKCAQMKCGPGEPCPCERGGLKTQSAPQLKPFGGVYGETPNCPDPPCGDPGTSSGSPGVGGPPVPPPGGPRPGPGSATQGIGTAPLPTTPLPATRGIGTVSPLQQKGTIPVSPLQQIGR